MYDGCSHIDDEGYVLNRYCLIKNGVLKGIVGSRDFGRNNPYTPFVNRARRESHRKIATGRTYCLCLNKGSCSLPELLHLHKDAFIIGNLSNSYYDSKCNDVILHSNDVYCFINGVLKKAPVEIKIRQKGSVLLSKIIEISYEREYSEHMCFASSGYVSNATLTPSIVLGDIKYRLYKK